MRAWGARDRLARAGVAAGRALGRRPRAVSARTAVGGVGRPAAGLGDETAAGLGVRVDRIRLALGGPYPLWLLGRGRNR